MSDDKKLVDMHTRDFELSEEKRELINKQHATKLTKHLHSQVTVQQIKILELNKRIENLEKRLGSEKEVHNFVKNELISQIHVLKATAIFIGFCALVLLFV